jgi:hypothetical protein
MTKFITPAFGMVRLALPTQLPSVGISLGESGSDVFHITTLLRNNLSIFWEVGNFTQYAKNLLMVISDPLLLVISMLSSLGFRFVRGPSNTNAPQPGSDGDTAVAVGVGEFVGIDVFVNIRLWVEVKTGVDVFVGAGVFVGGFVGLGVGVLVGEGVILGSTTNV